MLIEVFTIHAHSIVYEPSHAARKRDAMAGNPGMVFPPNVGAPAPLQIEIAKNFLRPLARVFLSNRHIGGSYNLKHRAEERARHYVSNGALIVAAIELGIRVKQSRWQSPSMPIGVDRRLLPKKPAGATGSGAFGRRRV